MPRHDHPTVLITRPAQDAARFVEAIREISGDFDVVVSPAFELEAVLGSVPDFEAAIFTSRRGVAYGPRGEGRVAWCVGDATAQAARDAGYSAITADGNADDLVALILERQPAQSLLHVRGESSRGDVMVRLVNGGLRCDDFVAYRKVVQVPDDRVLAGLGIDQRIIIPLFSSETVSILTNWPVSLADQTIVAISDEVAADAARLDPSEIIVSRHPNMQAMAQSVAGLIA